MTRFLHVFIFLLLVCQANAQEEATKVYFSQAISMHLNTYNSQADTAVKHGDIKAAKKLFNRFVKEHLEGTYLDNLTYEGYNTSLKTTEAWQKPTLLLTYDSWCIPNASEIPTLNKLAKQYEDLINVVVIYWDSKKEVRKHAKQFDKTIQVVYVDESKNKHMRTVKLLKHALGLSLSYVIAADGEILDINRRPPNKFNAPEESFRESVSFISEQMAAIYLDLNLDPSEMQEALATF